MEKLTKYEETQGCDCRCHRTGAFWAGECDRCADLHTPDPCDCACHAPGWVRNADDLPCCWCTGWEGEDYFCVLCNDDEDVHNVTLTEREQVILCRPCEGTKGAVCAECGERPTFKGMELCIYCDDEAAARHAKEWEREQTWIAAQHAGGFIV